MKNLSRYKCRAKNCRANTKGECLSGDAHLQTSVSNKVVTHCSYCKKKTGKGEPTPDLIFPGLGVFMNGEKNG